MTAEVAPGDDDMSHRYTALPLAALADDRLQDVDVRVLGVLCKYADNEGYAWPSAVQIARWIGRSERTVRRSLERLATANYLLAAPIDRRRRRLRVCCGKRAPGLPDTHDQRGEEMRRREGRRRSPVSGSRDEAPVAEPDTRDRPGLREPDNGDAESGHPCPGPWGSEGEVVGGAVREEPPRARAAVDERSAAEELAAAVALVVREFPGAKLLGLTCVSCGMEAEALDRLGRPWCLGCEPW